MNPRSRRVVVVDDHPAFLESMQAWLRHEGLDVVGVATTAEEGLAVATRTAAGLVLLDVHLPDRSGLECAREFAGLSSSPAVILISSDTAAADDAAARSEGVAGFLPKQEVSWDSIAAVLSSAPPR